MAASKPEILISQLLDEIETKFRLLDLHFRGAAFEWDEFKYCPTKLEVSQPAYLLGSVVQNDLFVLNTSKRSDAS